MPDKAYAILFLNGYLYFPIKRNNREYGGMPQFFGGTKNQDESDQDTIKREMSEESDRRITLEPGGLKRIHTAQVGTSTYNFYVAEKFSGANCLGELKNAEMAKVDKFLVEDGATDGVEDLLERLNISPDEDFAKSETYTAFSKAIKWSEKK